MFGSERYGKTKELIIYVANKLSSKGNYGATLLNKALYFIDNINYLKTSKPISELTYIKQDHGPTPDPSTFLFIKDVMWNAGEIEIHHVEYYGRVQKKLVAKREADIKKFTGQEIDLINQIISSIENWDANFASEISHQYPAWQTASNKEVLPFFTFLITGKTPSEKDLEWAKAELAQLS